MGIEPHIAYSDAALPLSYAEPYQDKITHILSD